MTDNAGRKEDNPLCEGYLLEGVCVCFVCFLTLNVNYKYSKLEVYAEYRINNLWYRKLLKIICCIISVKLLQLPMSQRRMH